MTSQKTNPYIGSVLDTDVVALKTNSSGQVVTTDGQPVGGGSPIIPSGSLSAGVGEYVFFQDTDGSLKILTPDLTKITLVNKT